MQCFYVCSIAIHARASIGSPVKLHLYSLHNQQQPFPILPAQFFPYIQLFQSTCTCFITFSVAASNKKFLPL